MGRERGKMNRMKNKMKKIKRCQRCKKPTLIDISSELQQINPFTYRGYQGVKCTSCNWDNKIYEFNDVEEGKG